MVLAATKREQILIKQKLKSNPPQSFPMPIDHRTESMPGIPAAIITTPTNNTRVENSEFVKGTAHNTEGEQYYLWPVSYTHLRAHETGRNLVCRLLLEKKKKK